MKIGKFEFAKSTISVMEIIFVFVALGAVGAYYIPQMLNKF